MGRKDACRAPLSLQNKKAELPMLCLFWGIRCNYFFLAAFLGAAFFAGAFFAGAFFAVAIFFPFLLMLGFGGLPPHCRRVKNVTLSKFVHFNLLIGCI
jgi:hypothetical protein